MKIKRFLEKDSRSAMSRVRAELGTDAVILSNKNIGSQVELVAAIGLDETSFDNKEISSPQSSDALPLIEDVAGATLSDLQRELGNLRTMIEGKLSQLAWRDVASRSSAKAALGMKLAGLGLSRTLSGVISDVLPDGGNVDEYWDVALQMLSARISVTEEDSLIEEGGIVALMGTTGVGKTTTLAKLAARCVMRHGGDQVALVTMDRYRIGGQEQLKTFANYLGIPMIVATDGPGLNAALAHLMPRKLILIDTAGMGQRDPRLYEQYSILNSVRYNIAPYVVLPATAQLQALREVVAVFGEDALAGAMITKMDESVSLGGVIDVLVETGLKLAYMSNGQKVPDDIIPARPDALIAAAIELAQEGLTTSPHITGEPELNESAMVRN